MPITGRGPIIPGGAVAFVCCHALPVHSQVSVKSVGALAAQGMGAWPAVLVAAGGITDPAEPVADPLPLQTVPPWFVVERPPTRTRSCVFGSYVIAAFVRAGGDADGCCSAHADPFHVHVSPRASPVVSVPPNSTS